MIKIFKLSNREFKILSIFRSLNTSLVIFNQNTNENDNYEEPCDLPPVIPSIVKRNLLESVSCSNTDVKPKQAWLETLKCPDDRKLGFIDLHPDVFGAFPRLDLINLNLRWQGVYRFVDWRKITTRPEVERTGKKMWPQKGSGRARHGDRTAPQFIGGAQVKGPLGPRAYFSVLPIGVRLLGLTSTLSIKLFQDNLHIVDDLNLPTDDKEYLINLIEGRNWGKSVLFVNSTDEAPRNISKICSLIPHYMVIPAYAVNVWSLIKYDTVILTLPSLNIIEEKLIVNLKNPAVDMKSTRSFQHFRHSNHDSWDQRQNTNFRGNPATHDDYLEYQ